MVEGEGAAFGGDGFGGAEGAAGGAGGGHFFGLKVEWGLGVSLLVGRVCVVVMGLGSGIWVGLMYARMVCAFSTGFSASPSSSSSSLCVQLHNHRQRQMMRDESVLSKDYNYVYQHRVRASHVRSARYIGEPPSALSAPHCLILGQMAKT